MSISKLLARNKKSMRFLIPCAGKMFRSSIGNDEKALCFVLNKGYLESVSLDSLYYTVEGIRDDKENNWLFIVGKIDKVQTTQGIVYRQRLFMKSISTMCDFCKQRGIVMEFTPEFEITMNNIVLCSSELPYLEFYSRHQRQSIDWFLTDTCIVQLGTLLEAKKMESPIISQSESILHNKRGYLDRAPFLASAYNIGEHTSSVYIPTNVSDTRKYTFNNWGYTSKNVEVDREAGVFRK